MSSCHGTGSQNSCTSPWPLSRGLQATLTLFSLAEHLERLSEDGDPLEVFAGTVEFERFRLLLVKGLGYSDGAKGGRPPFDPVAMFKVLVVQAQHNLSDARIEFMIRDRLSWMRFFGFDLGGAMPDENSFPALS